MSPHPEIAIIGSYPPPFGGVANHVERLCGLLDRRGIPWTVYNAVSDTQRLPRVVSVARRRFWWLLCFSLTGREPIVYVLSDRVGVWMLAAFMSVFRRKRVLIRLRNQTLPRATGVRGWCAELALRHVSGVVSVSSELYDEALRRGVDSARLIRAPGFLPPTQSPSDRAGVNPDVWSFVDAHHPVIAANGKVNWYDGEDLYGLDMITEAVRTLRGEHPRLGAVICFWDYDEKDEEYLARLRTTLNGENILFNTAAGIFVPVLAAADVFVRPTVTDGDANSVREALFLGIPAVASDVVLRPEGTITFRSRDQKAFVQAIRFAIEEQTVPQVQIESGFVDRYVSWLIGNHERSHD